jgi:hypothetical protein
LRSQKMHPALLLVERRVPCGVASRLRLPLHFLPVAEITRQDAAPIPPEARRRPPLRESSVNRGSSASSETLEDPLTPGDLGGRAGAGAASRTVCDGVLTAAQLKKRPEVALRRSFCGHNRANYGRETEHRCSESGRIPTSCRKPVPGRQDSGVGEF